MVSDAGVCTHLGCVPLKDKGDYNGFWLVMDHITMYLEESEKDLRQQIWKFQSMNL